MKKAIWFSRHQPTPAQIEDAAKRDYALEATETGLRLGAQDLRDNGDVIAVVSALLGHCAEVGAVAIFGVWAAPLLAQLARTADDIRQRGEIAEAKDGEGDYPCFAAWNVQRTAEGGKPTFEHLQWVAVGRLNQNSLRWLQ